MKRRTFQAILFCLAVVPIGGCGTTPDQRVTTLQDAITRTQAISQELDAKIRLLQDVIGQAKVLLADPNSTDKTLAYLREALPKLEAKLAAAQPVKQLVDQQLAVFQSQLSAALAAGPIDLQKELATYGQGITAAGGALPPPWNAIALLLGSVVLPLVGGIVGAVAKGKKDQGQLDEKDNAIKGIVDSVEALLKGPLVTDANAAKKELAYFQAKNAPEAAAAVQEVKAART